MNSEFELVIKVRSENVAKFESYIAKMNKLAVKLVNSEFSAQPLYSIITYKKYTPSKTVEGISKVVEVKDMVYLVKGCLPVVSGWELIAKLEFASNCPQPIVKTVPGKECPEVYFSANSKLCDHCHSKRFRSVGYVLFNGSEYKQVGSSCLADFLREDVIEMMDYYAKIWTLMDAGSKDEEDRPYGKFNNYWESDLLVRANRLIKKYGYRPVSAEYSTITQLWNCVYNTENQDKASEDVLLFREHCTEEEYAEIERILEEGRTLEPGNNSYLHNVKVLSQAQYWLNNQISIMTSWLASYHKKQAEKKVVAEKPLEQPSQHVGLIFGRYTTELTLNRLRSFDSQWGLSWLHSGKDAQGNIICFYSGNKMAEEGEKIKVIGTVKAHQMYKEKAQTVLNRVKQL